jgi:putative multiple sugar transport system permease protein
LPPDFGLVAGMIVWLGLRPGPQPRLRHGRSRRAFFILRNLLVSGAHHLHHLQAVDLPRSAECADHHGHPDHYLCLHDGITVLGRRIYALGGNEKAAKLSGIKTERLTFLTFVNMGMLAALAGLIFAARLNTATPKAGFAFELDVIAAVFIGGASMSGGVGKIVGAVVGAFIMGVMNNGMSIMGIGIDYQQVIKGLVLLAAVFSMSTTRRNRADQKEEAVCRRRSGSRGFGDKHDQTSNMAAQAAFAGMVRRNRRATRSTTAAG